jgi:hypothetical protein
MVFLARAFLVRPLWVCEICRAPLSVVERGHLNSADVAELGTPVHQQQPEELVEMTSATFLQPIERAYDTLRRAVREQDIYLEMQVYAVEAKDALSIAFLAVHSIDLGRDCPVFVRQRHIIRVFTFCEKAGVARRCLLSLAFLVFSFFMKVYALYGDILVFDVAVEAAFRARQVVGLENMVDALPFGKPCTDSFREHFSLFLRKIDARP